MHTLYLCVHCVVWLVFLDPQCSIYHAETPTQQERSGQCEFDRWEPSWSRALQLAPGGRLGPQPIPREWSRKSTQTTVRTLSNLSTDTPPKQSKVWYIWYISHFPRCSPLLQNVLLFSLWPSSRLKNLSRLTLSAVVPGNVSWWALHRETGEGCHGKVQEGAGRDNQLHQEEEWGKEATILQHVSWQNPKQCCSLRIQTRLI